MKIVKNADFIEGFFNGIIKKTDPKKIASAPFSSIFDTIAPVVLWRISWPLGLVAFIGDHFGYGPSYLWKLVDKYILKNGKPDFSDENVKQASESAVDEFLDKTKSLQTTSADYFLNNIKQVKGYIDKEDIIVSLYASNIYKIAKTSFYKKPGILRKLLNFITVSKATISLSGIVYGIVKTIIKGLIGAGIISGIASMMGEKEKPTKTQYYSNIDKNVEDTLIKFLNATITNFSDTFSKINKKPLKNSEEMKKVLSMIETINKDSINNINSYDAFNAPQIFDIAYVLMPQAKYEKFEGTKKPKEELKKELIDLLKGV